MTATPASTSLLKWIDTALDEILANPHGWGGVDALEPVILLLAILRGEFSSPRVAQQEVLRHYWAFLAAKVRPGSDDLRARLGERLSTETMVAVLREYVELVRRWAPGRPPPASEPRRPFPRFCTIDCEGRHG